MRPPKSLRLTSRPALVRHVAAVAPRFPPTTTRRCAVRVVGDLSAKGRPILPKAISVQRIMGEGSFGQVFEGFLTMPTGNQRVVLKRVKTRVQGAEEMSQMEHLLNVYASRVARGHCADFLGYCEVADSEANAKLTSGLWLVWKYEGSKTLAYYLKRRDTVRALATDLQIPEELAVPTVMKHIFEGLAAFHAAGLVHRDVKPLNMILAEDVRRFKLIDLGACADLRSGTNYVPEESILDLNFCPPEQFVMPTDSPHIAKQAGLFKLAISPMLWAKHKPDRFDTWSAGIVMLQLAIPAMRTDRALRNFNAAYGPKYKYDLAAWRRGIHLSARDCALLDADGGAGWELLQSLLAPRHIQVDENGGVSFVNDTPFQRISAFEALKHRYVKSAVEAAAASVASTSGSTSAAAATASRGGSGSGGAAAAEAARRAGKEAAGAAAAASGGEAKARSGGGGGVDPLGSALGMWRDMTGRLFDLEARIMRQTSATELQTTTVRRLKEQVDSGRVDPEVLQREEKVLNKMQNRLAGLQQDFSSTANQASGILSFFGFGAKPQQQQQAQQQQQQQQAPQAASSSKSQQNLQALRSAEAASTSAASTSTASSPVASAAGIFNSVWERLGARLGELERQISNQASATERQSLVVRNLRAKVKAGEVEPEMLAKAERTLSRMERRLLDLDRDYWAAKQNAKGALAGNMPGDGGKGGKRAGSREQSVGSASASTSTSASISSQDGGAQSDSDADVTGGSFWSRLLGSSSGSRSGSSMDGSSREAAAAAAAAAQASTATAPPPSSSSPPSSRSASPFFRRSVDRAPAPQAAAAAATPGSGYRSIFGAFSGLTGGADASKKSVDVPPPPPPPAAAATPAASKPAAAAAALARAISPRSRGGGGGGGGGGFLGGLFGRPRQEPPASASTAAAAAATAAPAAATGKAPAAAAPPATSSSAASSSSSASSSSGVPVPLPAAPSSASGGDALVEGASRVIRNSLSFTGLAAKIAGDLAAAFKEDAERYLKDLEVQEAAKKQRRTLDLAFLALLREAQPPVASSCSYEEAEVRFAGEARWAALAEEPRRRELFAKYLPAARKVEEQAAAAADAAFRAALRRYNVSASSQWEDFRAQLADSDPAVAGVADEGRRQRLFVEVVAELQLQAALQAASLKAELEFTAMLAELVDPAVTSTSTWALVRKVVAADPRCQALPERRRRELFETFTARLFEQEARRSEIAATAAQVAELQAAEAAAAAAVAAATAAAAAPAEPPPPRSPPQLPLAIQPAVVAPAPTAAAAPPPAPSSPAAAASAAAAPWEAAPLVDDDDLSAALAGMEAALETAFKAVTSAPRPAEGLMVGSEAAAGAGAAAVGGPAASGVAAAAGAGAAQGGSGVLPVVVGGGSGGAPPVPVPVPVPVPATVPANGVARKAVLAAGGAAAAESIRLEELRREQARLRAEYEAMAQRLREMEERLMSQAQLMTSVEGDVELTAPAASGGGGALEGAASGSGGIAALRDGAAAGGGSDGAAGALLSGSDGSMAPVGGPRWR